jgi:hypothetical protein
MSRPTDDEFSENKARALWKLALNFVISSVRSRTLWWHVLRERRDKRRRFIRIVLIHQSNHQVTSDNDDNEYKELVRTTHPDDLALWRSISSLSLSRRIYWCAFSAWIIVYAQLTRSITCRGLNCDVHGGALEDSACVTCVECSRNEVNGTLDLCLGCIDASVRRETDGRSHVPEHTLVQRRDPLLRTYVRDLLENGARIAQTEQENLYAEGDRPTFCGCGDAIRCKQRELTGTYWRCIEEGCTGMLSTHCAVL